MLKDMSIAGFLVGAAMYDVFFRLVANRYVKGSMLCGWLYNCFFCVPIWKPLGGILVTIAVGAALYLLGAIRAADVKVLLVLSLFIGTAVGRVIWGSLVLTALFGTGFLLYKRKLFSRLKQVWYYAMSCIRSRQFYSYALTGKEQCYGVPFVLFIFLSWAVLWWEEQGCIR